MIILEEGWNILYYQTPQGTFPLQDFINSLDARAKSKVVNTINLLEQYGIRLGPPHAKKLVGTNLWELRMLGQDNIRILYVAITGKKFLLLHGFNKKTQKTDKKEIDTALARLKVHFSR